MFGCEYMDGRPQSAPSLRAAVGTSKGELLAVEDSVQWDGRTFPRAEGEYRDLPDAYSRMQGLLPHLHRDLCKRFPQIHCGENGGLEDAAVSDALEARGTALGMRGSAAKS